MRKIFVSAVLLFVFQTSFCQLDKKYWLVGGSGSINTYKRAFTTSNSDILDRFTDISIVPKIGYFFFDKTSFGVSSSFSYSHFTPLGNSNASKSSFWGISGGPFARYYFLKKEKIYNILIDIRYQFGGVLIPSSIQKMTGKNNEFAALAGTEIFFNSTAGIEILLGYKSSTLSVEKPTLAYIDKRNGFYVSIGFNLHLTKL